MNARGAGLAVLAVFLVLVGGGYLGTRIRDGEPPDKRQRDAEAGAADLDALRATRRDLEERISRLQDLARAQRAPAKILDLISMALPGPLSLERLSLREKTVTIAGRAANTYAIADFVESLHGTRGFGEPETRSITTSNEGYRFSLAFLIDPDTLLTMVADSDPPPEPAARSVHPAQSGEELRVSIGELETRLDRLLPDARQTDDLLRRIRALARDADVALLRFRPREIIDGDFHRQWPIDISVDAPYLGLVSFLDQIGRSGRLVVPGNLDVVATQGESGTTATLVLTAYLRSRDVSGAPPREHTSNR